MITHTHHIIPKHMGGKNGPTIELTIEEHAAAHKNLYDQYGNEKDRIAWLALLGQITKTEINYLKCIGNKSRTGQKQSLEERQKKSIALKLAYREGRKVSWNKGKTYKELGIDSKIFGQVTPWNKGKPGYSTNLKGRRLTEDHKKKLSLAKIGHIPWNKGLKVVND